ncbi:DNA polymerase [uncultured Selenomonas sp.]|uniref:DNA polymerase n=1 Tax=uncultured Selenomonas sp. TaxID=159275 RepID=UPI0028ECB554|nr:DNA polymerase [uncultured Selenomonas sp.]
MKSISIDLETRSSVDISKSGVYRYAEAENFAILLFAYAVDGGETQAIDLANGEQIPQEILDALIDESVIKWAFNANFERVCLSRYLSDLGIDLDPFRDNHPLSTECAHFLNPRSWRCTMVWSAYMGLPLSLAAVGRVLGLEEQKMTEGKTLIRYFSTPPFHEPTGEKWELFKSYNRRDVEVEMAIQQRLFKYPVPQSVWEEYVLDQEINDRGIRLDMSLVENAVKIDAHTKEKLTDRLKTLTSLENPNSVTQMKAWLKEQGVETESLDKKSVTALLTTVQSPISDVLMLRQQLAKSSVKKYQAMQNTVCADSRARGMFQFYGANRTGRFSGRHIQLQNLPQNHLADLEYARSLVRQGNYEALEMLYESVPDILSQLIRTAFIPKEGRKFIVADFSAIEARVLSWLAKERWRMDVFEGNGDIYCATAGRMFHCNVVKHGENGHLRQYGKLAELSSGYGGSVGALKAFGALESGMKEEELKPLVDAWRAANPNIVDFWWAVDRAAKDCIKERSTKVTHGIRFIYRGSMMFIELPSSRRLAYVKPRIGENRFGGESITYMGLDLSKKWARIESYGPKLVENITQAISRDILCYAMQTLRTMDIVAHVHDEIIIECDERTSLSAVCEQMARTPPWAEGLLLRADGFECAFYQKD